MIDIKVLTKVMNLTPVESEAFETDVEQNSLERFTKRQLRITASDCKLFFTRTDLTYL